jgi:cytochrome c
MCRRRLLAVAMMLTFGASAAAQGPTFKLGRTPTGAELRPADAAVGPDGKDLPPGRGTAKEGAMIYIARGCAGCHGPTGTEGPAARLIGPPGGDSGIASHPFAPLIWSYINQMMPLDSQLKAVLFRDVPGKLALTRDPAPCCLASDEVYSLTAYLLYRSGIVKEDDVMNADSLPQVRMPKRDSYVPPPFSEWKPGMRQAPVK